MENSNMSDPTEQPVAPTTDITPSSEKPKDSTNTTNSSNKPQNNNRNGNKRFKKNDGGGNKGGEDDRKKRKKEQAQYGNYESYYGYRPSGEQDNRINIFSKELIHQKRCLDIGCNSGYFTIQIAMNYEPRYILGVDIDKTLITKAQKNVLVANATKRRETKEDNKTTTTTITTTEATNKDNNNNNNNETTTSSTTTISTTTTIADTTNTNTNVNTTDIDPRPTIDGAPYFPSHFGELPPGALSLSREVHFPNNVHFRGENFIDNEEVTERFDIIFCLSVTKWVHLNWGDEGIKKLFRKMYASLYQGGILVLEPQPWSSYKKRARITPEINRNYVNSKLRPNDFSSYLTTHVGFKTAQLLVSPTGPEAKGFDRPVYLYVK